MRTFLLMSLIALGFSFCLAHVASAVCVQNGNTPGGGNIINCPAPVQNSPLNTGTVPGTTNLADEVNIPDGGGLDVGGGNAVETDDGNDIVNISGGSVTADSTAIDTGNDNDTVTVDGGNLIGGSQAIQDPGGNDTIIVNGGLLDGGLQTIQMNSIGDNVITVNGGTLIAGNEILEGANFGNDIITVNGGLFDLTDTLGLQVIDSNNGNDVINLNGGTYLLDSGVVDAVTMRDGNDILTFGADVDLGARVSCGDGFDTIVFGMEVPEEAVGFFSSRINGADPAGDSIVINDITYEWIDCELLVAQLVGVRVVRPIPTLSEWGLIAMAGVLGIVGLLAVRRKTISA